MHTHGLKDNVLGQLELPATTLYVVYLQPEIRFWQWLMKWQFTSRLKYSFMMISTQFRNSLRNNYVNWLKFVFKTMGFTGVFCLRTWLNVQLELQGK